MRLKDVYCEVCGRVERDVDVETLDWVEGSRRCEACGEETPHRAMVNGGCGGYVWRFLSWSEANASGHVQFEGVKVTNDDGTPYAEGDGHLLHDEARFSAEGAKEREAKRDFLRRRATGRDRHFLIPRGKTCS